MTMGLITFTLCLVQIAYLLTVIIWFGRQRVVAAPTVVSMHPILVRRDSKEFHHQLDSDRRLT